MSVNLYNMPRNISLLSILAMTLVLTSCATASVSLRIERAERELKNNLSANDTISDVIVGHFVYCGVAKGSSSAKVYKSKGEQGSLYLHMPDKYNIIDYVKLTDYENYTVTDDIVPPLTVYVCVKAPASLTLNDIRGPSPNIILAIRRKIGPGSSEYNSNYDNDSRLRGKAIYIDDGVIRVLEIQQSTKVNDFDVFMLKLLKISYIVTIPIDIITLPLQVLVVLTDSGAPATPFF